MNITQPADIDFGDAKLVYELLGMVKASIFMIKFETVQAAHNGRPAPALCDKWSSSSG